MAHTIIERYIDENYGKWLNQTRRKCYRFGINPGYANDLLQEVFFTVFKTRNETSILEMIATIVHNNYSMLEIFISRTMRYRMMNVKKHNNVLARIMSDTDITNCEAEQSDEQIGYDVYEKQKSIVPVISRLKVNKRTKYILTHKLVCNQNLCQLPWDNHTVTKAYRQGLQQLSQQLRFK